MYLHHRNKMLEHYHSVLAVVQLALRCSICKQMFVQSEEMSDLQHRWLSKTLELLPQSKVQHGTLSSHTCCYHLAKMDIPLAGPPSWLTIEWTLNSRSYSLLWKIWSNPFLWDSWPAGRLAVGLAYSPSPHHSNILPQGLVAVKFHRYCKNYLQQYNYLAKARI